MQKMSKLDDQQFCLRWNNFQANITSQFENLRDEEDFTDVTIACEGQQLQAHKIVLSACSPLFKDLFKSNPCSHPIIFMRDVEAQHIVALMEFMYAGEVNVAQAQLGSFLKTAESLKIRGLTDTSSTLGLQTELRPASSKVQLYCSTLENSKSKSTKSKSTCTVTSSQDFSSNQENLELSKNQFLAQTDKSQQIILADNDENIVVEETCNFEPKIEIPEYFSDEDVECSIDEIPECEMDILRQSSNSDLQLSAEDNSPPDIGKFRKRASREENQPLFKSSENVTSTIKSFSYKEKEETTRKVKLGEGVEILEDQLRTVKWSDYRKLTRGLATILFSPTELATCSVTGQRWSRATDGNRPVKPALDRSKVQAIISYVATRFPTVEISRIKQVLAYKCKENSTAFKMKAVRYYSKHLKRSI